MAWRTLLYLTVLISGGLCQDDFSVKPNDQTVETRARVVLPCQVNAAMHPNYAMAWYRGSKDRAQLYIYSKDLDKGTITHPEQHEVESTANGEHNLIIKSATLTDGMFYFCVILTPSYAETSMNLIVVEKPDITSSMQFLANTEEKLTCEGRFGSPQESDLKSDHKPFLQGYIDMKILDDIASTIQFGTPGLSAGKAHYQGNVTIKPDMDQKIFLCEFRTEIPYFYVKDEKIIEVHHEVTEIHITPTQEVYYPGDTLNCSANGNPVPQFSWKAESSPGSRPVTGTVLEIFENMIGENIWQCRAINQPAGSLEPAMVTKSYKFIVEARPTEKPEDNPQTANTNVVVIVVVCVLAILIIVGAAVGFYCFRKKKTSKSYGPRAATKDFNLESDLGDVDTDDEYKTKPKKHESQKMLPPQKQVKEKMDSNSEKAPLKTTPLKSEDPQENGGKSSQPPIRQSDVPPTPPPPFEDVVFQSLVAKKSEPGTKPVPPGAKPVLPVAEPPSVSHKPVPKARTGSRENSAESKPPIKARSKENLTDDGTSV